MNCETATDLVIDELMDDLDPQDAELLEAHLASCAECATAADQIRHMWDGLSRLEIPARLSAESMVDFGRQLERTRRRPTWPLGLKAAAAVGLIATGALLGRIGGPESPPVGEGSPRSEYILLVRGDEPDRRFPDAQLTSEYRAWAQELAGAGRLVGAEKLEDDSGDWVSLTARPDVELRSSSIRGFFLIRAASYTEAMDIARQSPHVSYGGIMEVRAIDRE